MKTLSFFDRFPASRRLHEDEDLVVVDKPWGLSTHAADPGRSDDVVSWLRADYRGAGVDPYLGIHQRLDRDTSGVLLFARRKQANGPLAQQFEQHQVKKTYLAVVIGRVPDETRLEHFIREGREGKRECRPKRGRPERGEQLAVTRLSVLKRAGKRALVELHPETGRTHQLRVQLSAIGAPIVGDELYGGEPFGRLMLHASRLELRHPADGRPCTFEAEVPFEFEAYLSAAPSGSNAASAPTAPSANVSSDPKSPTGEPAPHVKDARYAEFEAALERRYGISIPGETEAYRMFHRGADGDAGLSIDVYGTFAVVSHYEPPTDPERIYAALLELGFEGVYKKHRPKNASRIVDSRTNVVAPSDAVAGQNAPSAFFVKELGIAYEVRLGDGLSTGIFLDQRENRRKIRELALEKRVLNLFGYTGAFSVAASVGGARQTTTVDSSRTVLEWAERNLTNAGSATHELVESDAFAFLERSIAQKKTWDLVIVDPPSFSTTKASVFSAESDYGKLATSAIRVAEAGATLLFCTNHTGIAMLKFRRVLHEATRAAGRTPQQMKTLVPGRDFPSLGHSHQKSVLLTLVD